MDYQNIIFENYPLHLQQQDVNNPLSVIADFFMSDRLSGHLRKLKKWRKHVISDKYFKGKRSNPADLLMIHRDVIRLVEVAFLLNESDDFITRAKIDEAAFEETIANERKAWECHTQYLNVKQLADPMRVICKFCNAYTMQKYRDYLQEWLIFGLSKHACIDLETEDIIRVYENLQKLFEASWLIRNRCLTPLIKQQ